MLNRTPRAELLVQAIRFFMERLAPDCLSFAYLGVSDKMFVVVEWHTDGAHGPGQFPRIWLPINPALADPRGIEVLAEEIIGPEVRRHLAEDHRPRT
jgi:hypothetical protein